MDTLMDHSCINLIFLSLAFMLLYSPYYASSSIIKYSLTLYNMSDVSFTAVAILYGSFGAGNFIAPFVLEHFAVRKLLFFFSFAFSAYLASFISPIRELIISCACFLGFSNAVLWASQSTYLTRNSSKNNLSRDNSIFRGIFQLSSLLGGLFLLFALSTKSNKTDLFFKIFIAFVLIALAGAFSMLVIWYRSRNDPKQLNHEKGGSEAAIRKRFKFGDVFKVLMDFKFVLMIPIIMQSGFSVSFIMMLYPSFLTSVYTNDSSQEMLLRPEIAAEYGIAVSLSILASNGMLVVLGTRVTKYHNTIFMIVAAVLAIIGYLLPVYLYRQFSDNSFSFYPTMTSTHHHVLTAFIAILTGTAEGISSTRITTLLGSRYVDSLPEVFSMYKFVQTFSTSLSFATGASLKFIIRMYIMVFFQIFGTVLYIFTLYRSKTEKVKISQVSSMEGFADSDTKQDA